MEQLPHATLKESLQNLVGSPHDSPSNPAGGPATLISLSDNAVVEGVKSHAEASIASALRGQVPLLSGSTIGDLATSAKSLAGPSHAIEGTAATVSADDIKGKAEAFVMARLRTIAFSYAAKLPFVGAYFKRDRPTLDSETTPLLGAIQNPEAFATKQVEGLLRRVLSPVSNRLPDIDALDNAESDAHGTMFRILVECYVLARSGAGWLFTHIQEHSLVVAPTVSLGHLSTTDLAASTIGTAVASVTGYSVIQGFISSLDKVLEGSPNRHVAKVACAQAAVVTGIALLPITNLWAVQSGALLQRLGQSPEVAGPASEFLRVTAAGLPGYAIGEIAKRYLTSRGLAHVHTRMLSATAPMNLALNYLLVDGPIPALRLGFAGAPLCTVLSHNALAIMLIIYIVQRAIRDEVEYLRGRNIIPDEPVRGENNTTGQTGADTSDITFFTGLGTLVSAGVSGVFKSASQLWSKDLGGGESINLCSHLIIPDTDNATLIVVASILGPNALATQAVLLTTATTLYQVPKAVSSASSKRVKKWIGGGDVRRAKIAAVVALVGTLTGVIVISSILLLSATSWGGLFNSDPVIIQNVSALLPVIAVFQVAHGLGAWVDSALGSLGKTAVFPSLNASADYVIGIPLGVYLALLRQWGLAGLWVGLTVSLAYSCLIATIVLVRTNWKNAVGTRGKAIRATEVAEVQEIHPAIEPRGFGTFA